MERANPAQKSVSACMWQALSHSFTAPRIIESAVGIQQ
jgi:hypothetical protein